jgi:KUP system potassium uptake protein
MTISIASSELSSPSNPPNSRSALAVLTLGAIGVVYGDIGTSPLYAFREALNQAAGGIGASEIMGVLSLMLWSLILIVTLKYVLFLTRADNRGQGGVLSLMALAMRATGGVWPTVLVLGAAGAALFYGDAMITPALSVLSAVEGLETVPGLQSVMTLPVVLGLTAAILVALFALQSRGTAKVAGLFGPVCAVWFAAIAALGVWQIGRAPQILLAFDPLNAFSFLAGHGVRGLFVLGAVFLTVTGAEALIADMGHFGRLPIQLGWLGFVWPALSLNYLGQGALALTMLHAAQASGTQLANADWFFVMAPDALKAPLVFLATLATIIASQAVITGAYSMTQQAIALGLVPRLKVRQTSADQIGQVYMPAVNWLLLGAVLLLIGGFQSSSRMAAAYGVAVTGTMVLTTCLAFVVAWRSWRWDLVWTCALFLPFLALDLVFFCANILRVSEGGWVPLLVAAVIGVAIFTWIRGRRMLLEHASLEGLPMQQLIRSLGERMPVRVAGVAVFLSENTRVAPSALLHNLKHNKVLHEANILLTIQTVQSPYVRAAERLTVRRIDPSFIEATLQYGYMDVVDVPSDLGRGGLLARFGGTSFFVGRNAIRLTPKSALPHWMALLYAFLHRNAADPTTYFAIPANRVVELGSQIEL